MEGIMKQYQNRVKKKKGRKEYQNRVKKKERKQTRKRKKETKDGELCSSWLTENGRGLKFSA
jgi:hypothetical protein